MKIIFIKERSMNGKNNPEWHRNFRQRGMRITEPRKAILEVLNNTTEHLSAEEIYMSVHRTYPNVGLTTVYRNLELLEEMGIIAKFHFGDGRSRYELIHSPQKPGHHHHLICTGCKQIIDYDDFVEEEIELLTKVEQALSAAHNFQITGHTIQFYGICHACRGNL